MSSNIKPKCGHPDCHRNARYGYKRQIPADRCKKHREERKLWSSICWCCTKLACFGLPGQKATRCSKHQAPGMVDVKHKRCEDPECSLRPSFGLPGRKATRCFEHQAPGMVDVINKRCEDPECSTRPIFGLPGQKATRCSYHKKTGMVDVVSRIRCEDPDCKKGPSYGLPGQKATRCVAHKKPGMVNVVSKRCEKPDCTKQPNFGLPGQKATRCFEHRKQGMVDVINKRCEDPECTTRASFGLPGQKATRCANHRKPGMVDIVSKRCEKPDCTTRAGFGLLGQKATRCVAHKKPGMVDVINKRCEDPECTTLACFGLPGQKATRCVAHKKTGMVDVIHKRCRSTYCDVRPTKKYDFYCVHCFVNLFPKDPRCQQIRSKSKENCVRDFISTFDSSFIHDKPLYTSHCDCSIRRRIDHRKSIGNTLLAIETDEFQHRSYDKENENDRYHDLEMGFGGKLVFIRFNPDSYKDSRGRRRNPELQDRLPILKQAIEEQEARIRSGENTELLEIVYLFYDGYDMPSPSITTTKCAPLMSPHGVYAVGEFAC